MSDDAAGRAENPRRGVLLLAIGALAGLVAALVSIAERPPAAVRPGPGVVASVGGRPIARVDYDRAVAALESDLERPAGEEERRRVLDKLIDEQLLVLRGLELDLPNVDPHVRRNLVRVMIDLIVGTAEESDPSDAELAAFFANHRGYFARPGRVVVRQVYVGPGKGEEGRRAAEARIEKARSRLVAGEDVEAVAAALGDEEVVPLPRGPVGARKLRDLVGPTALASIEALEPRGIGPVVRSGTGLHVFVLLERAPPEVPPLADIVDQVVAEYRRRAGEEALRRELARLRERTDVVVATGEDG